MLPFTPRHPATSRIGTPRRRTHDISFGAFLTLALSCLGQTAAHSAPAKPGPLPQKPNIVVFLADDLGRLDSTIYGSKDVHTPNMERISKEGLTFNRAFVASPSCAPSRAAMLTGLMPARNGAEPNQSHPRADVKMLPAYLHEQGYEVVAFGKVAHYGQAKDFGFDLVEHDGYHDDVCVNAALTWIKARKSKKPLAFFVGTNWPHVPWPKDGAGYNPADMKLPHTFVDTPQTRQWRTRYYAAVSRFDTELGEVYDAAKDKLGPNTFFLQSSDHGSQWPFGKWNLYDSGIEVSMMASWPGVIKPGTRTESMISWVDILPTLIEVAGGKPPKELDGRSFLPVLRDPQQPARDRIFTTHSGDGDMNIYPMRSVRTGRWKYILNLHPEFAYTTHIDRAETNSSPDFYWPTWENAGKTDPHAAQIVTRYRQRPAEELYDIIADPLEEHNLADLPANAQLKVGLRKELESWMDAQGDKRTVFNKPHLLISDDEVEKPQIAGKAFSISCDVTAQAPNGVILAQGGNINGYALYLQDGKPTFAVRESRELTTIASPAAPTGKFSVRAQLGVDGVMTLTVNRVIVAKGKAAGLIPRQPAEEFSVGRDTAVAVGDYTAPNALDGRIENVVVKAE